MQERGAVLHLHHIDVQTHMAEYWRSQLQDVKSILENMDACRRGQVVISELGFDTELQMSATSLRCKRRGGWRCGWTEDAVMR